MCDGLLFPLALRAQAKKANLVMGKGKSGLFGHFLS